MSFRTFGWFGPRCPQDTTLTLGHMAMYDYLNKVPLSGFPLEIASKIFWEADEITLNASLTATPAGGATSTFNGTLSVKWGEITNLSTFPPSFVRAPLNTAQEMLCIVSEPTQQGGFATSHTFFNSTAIARPRGFIQIRRRPLIQNNKLFAPFVMNMEDSFGPQRGAQIFITPFQQIQGAVIVGNAQWITPWGNTTTPYYFFDFVGPVTHVSSFMTITVTAADPATRYA